MIFGIRGTDELRKAKAVPIAICFFWISSGAVTEAGFIKSKIILIIRCNGTGTEVIKLKAASSYGFV